ncbi:MAG: indole-3-glycerol phosphate synthase TrpC [Ignavibacteriaceae bacterium]
MNFLDKILKVKKEEVLKLKKEFSLNSFRDLEFFNSKSLSFKDEVNRNKNISIIAEIKKASPSKGIIKKDFDHLQISKNYFEAEVNAVSILTDKQFFQGDIRFLSDIAKIKRSPLLRKDFIIDEIQIFEAKAKGADLILLISEVLSKNQIKDLSSAAFECGLEVLLELHSENQLDKIDFGVNRIIGINNRNLEDFKVDLNVTKILSKLIPRESVPSGEDVILVAESGIHRKEDVDFLRRANINAILVGESIMRSDNMKSKIAELKSWCSNES